MYAEVFDLEGKIENRLEAFASHNGPDFYGMPRNADTITLVKEEWNVAEVKCLSGSNIVVPIRGGETIWQAVK